jgi:D-cysteine desulfhydrase
MHLARFPRRRYTPAPTPLEPLANLTRLLGGPDLWIKRDDLTGLAGGGNKTRKLEFLVAEAIAQDCDTLITVGAVQSNHCRLTLAAAAKEGLKCRLLLEQRVPGSYKGDASGNNLLFDLIGAEKIEVVESGADLAACMAAMAEDLQRHGRKAYVIPGGGSNALGALGYVACAQELLHQAFEQQVRVDHVVVASGSAGTHAGLLVGLEGASADIPLIGVNVRRPRVEQEGNVYKLVGETAALLNLDKAIAREKVVALDDWVGPGYSLPTKEMVEAVRLLASTEAILLDPVYTGKAMAGLIGLVRQGRFKAGETVVFVHTGGSPALYAYQDDLRV